MTKQQLASKIWETANQLRSNIKSNEYKDYILGFMFYKYLSDKEIQILEENDSTIDDLLDKDVFEELKQMGYCFEKQNLFQELLKKGNSLGASDVNDALVQFNKSASGVFVDIFSTLQGGLSKFGKDNGSRDKAVRDIVTLVSDIPTTNKNYDVMGYIYEFLIYKFSTAAKDDGAFYTPHEVSSLIARIVAYEQRDKKDLTVYDPTCGSGSLLLTIGAEASKYIENGKDVITYYGQEKISETYNLARMNLIMKDIADYNIKIRCGDTLEQDWPYFSDTEEYTPTFVDVVVSNPPYSLRWKPDNKENDPRFVQGLAPSSKADYAFLQHCLYHLKPDGIMGIVLPHGVLFRGGTEGDIRKNLIDSNNIDTIVSLPANLFYATGIPTTVMFLKKNKKDTNILFVDASQYYGKEKTQNVLRESDIRRIYDAVINRKDISNFARVVSKEEIVANEYNLNIPRYVSAQEEAESYELYSLMSGAVSEKELDKYSLYFDTFKKLKDELFTKDAYEFYAFKDVSIKETVENDSDVKVFKEEFNKDLEEFYLYCKEVLLKLTDDFDVIQIKDALVTKLFELFSSNPMIDKYAVYESFSGIFKEIENDLDILMDKGLESFRGVDVNIVSKKTKNGVEDVQNGYKGVVFDFDLVKKTFFVDDYDDMKKLSDKISCIVAEREEAYSNLDEEVQKEVKKENADEFDMKKVKLYLKENDSEELSKVLKLVDEEKALNKQIKDIESSLNEKAYNFIPEMTDEQIRTLLTVKWLEPIRTELIGISVKTIMDFITALSNLKDKYKDSLGDINKEIEETSSKLKEMMSELTGSEVDMKALEILKSVL